MRSLHLALGWRCHDEREWFYVRCVHHDAFAFTFEKNVANTVENEITVFLDFISTVRIRFVRSD